MPCERRLPPAWIACHDPGRRPAAGVRATSSAKLKISWTVTIRHAMWAASRAHGVPPAGITRSPGCLETCAAT